MRVIVALLIIVRIISIAGTLLTQIHPILNAIHQDNQVKNYVRFGGDSVDVERDVFDEEGNSLLHHHHRRLGSLIHETIRTRLIYLPEVWPKAEEGELIEFELFDGMVVIGRAEIVMVRGDDSVGWNGDIRISTGNLEDDMKKSDGYFGLSCLGKSCVANIQIYSTDQEFHISPSGIPLEDDGGGIYAISEVSLDPARKTGVTSNHVIHSNTAEQPHHGNHVRGSINGMYAGVSSQAVDSDHIVDILAIYTPEAVTAYAGGR
jgi:hypothetical protein